MLFCGSFSSQIKREIKYRAKELSELSGENSRPLVCAHLKHQGGRPEGIFDYARNGRLVTDIEHLVHHELFQEIPRLIGLSKKQNNRTMKGLFENVIEYNQQNNIYDETFKEKYRNAQINWIELYDTNPRILGLPTKKKDDVIQLLIYTAEHNIKEYNNF